tara:strand:- start:164 stop:787 length:624 start_codon:yes stop_codon:yes gene_type:complete
MMNIQLEKPVFYRNEFALRFELGPDDVDIWLDYDRTNYNEQYFEIAMSRALSIYEEAFKPSDKIKVCYQIFSDGRKKIRKSDYFFKLFKPLCGKAIEFSEHRDIYTEDLEFKRHCWKRVTISGVDVSELNIKPIIQACIDGDFGDRSPTLAGQLFIINCDKELVYHLYDDRGLDVAASSQWALEDLYQNQNQLLLDYDKQYMDSLFK